jgi:murein DD-endopeptidase MepM/ murein hydrolase activator NlpD
LKREIPQKVDAKFGLAGQSCSASVARFCATLFRRTRSASLLSVTLTAGTLGALSSHQKAEAFPIMAPAPLGSVPSLPHLFNSADTSSESYQSFNYLGVQSGGAVLSANPSATMTSSSTVVFQPNQVLSTRLELSAIPSLDGSASPQGSVEATLETIAGLESAKNTGVIAASVNALRTQANESSEDLTLEDASTFVHKVEQGENLTEIADKYRVSPESIAQTNRIPDPNVIDVHEDLVIPSASLSAVVAAPLMLGTLANDAKVILNEADRQGISAKLLDAERSLSQPAPSESVQAVRPQSVQQPLPDIGGAQVTVESTEPSVQPPLEPIALHPSRRQSQESSASLRVTSPLDVTATVARRSAFPQMPSLDLPSLVSADQFLPSTFPGGGDALKYIWPARGVFTSGYGWRWGRMHRGIDISAPVGTPVVSSAAGVVETASWNDGGYGNLVEVRHPDGSLTVYAHNSRILVRTGAVVNQGELIAEMGSTGRSTGPHTHFEIRPRGAGAVNPMFFLSRS